MSYPMKPLSCDPARQWWELSASIFSVAKSRCAAYEGRAPEDQHRVREAGTSSKLAPSAGSRKARRRSSPIASASAEKELNEATANSCGREEMLPARTSSGPSRIPTTESEYCSSYRFFEPILMVRVLERILRFSSRCALTVIRYGCDPATSA
jgi:hypothetical protein